MPFDTGIMFVVAPLQESLTPFLRILELAFPAVPTGEERRAVLAALLSDMSEEGLSNLAAQFWGEDGVLLLDEAIHAVSDRPVPQHLVAGAKVRLSEAGWPWDE